MPPAACGARATFGVAAAAARADRDAMPRLDTIPHVRRILFSLATILSLGIGLALAALWVGSHTSPRYLVYIQPPQAADGGGVRARAAEVYVIRGQVSARFSHFHAADVSKLKGPLEIHQTPQWRFGSDYGSMHNEVTYETAWWNRLGFRYLRWAGRYWTGATGRMLYFTVPLWAVVLPWLVLPVGVVVRLANRRRRAHRGLCPRCGYDLRATLERCPECGTVAP
jgi:hypothetical protein